MFNDKCKQNAIQTENVTFCLSYSISVNSHAYFNGDISKDNEIFDRELFLYAKFVINVNSVLTEFKLQQNVVGSTT